MIDLDALENEANDAPFTFRFGGEEYILPARIDVRAVAAFTNGQLYAGLERLLGDEQWERLNKSTAVFDDRKLSALLDAYAKHAGTSMGESPASTDS